MDGGLALTNNVIIGIEYNHYDLGFGDLTVPFNNGGGSLITTNASRLTIDSVLGRLNYKF